MKADCGNRESSLTIVDAYGYGKRFIVRADEKLTAFVELQRAIYRFAVSLACTENRGRMVAL